METAKSVTTPEDVRTIDAYLSYMKDILGYSDWASVIEFVNDEVFYVPAVKTATEAVRYNCGNVYNLLWESPRFGPAELRAAHSIDLPFLIGTIKNSDTLRVEKCRTFFLVPSMLWAMGWDP